MIIDLLPYVILTVNKIGNPLTVRLFFNEEIDIDSILRDLVNDNAVVLIATTGEHDLNYLRSLQDRVSRLMHNKKTGYTPPKRTVSLKAIPKRYQRQLPKRVS